MQPEFIAKLIALVQKNGDRVVVSDSQTGKAVVLLDFVEYERLLAGGSTVPRQKDVPAPISLPLTPAPTLPTEPEKSAPFSIKNRPVVPTAPSVLGDLTQDELLAKINRDIGAWKTAQERRQPRESAPTLAKNPDPQPASALEDEERFYLEPLE